MPASLSLNPTPLEDSMPAPELVMSDVIDRIGVMRQQEETIYSVRDYLAETVKVRKHASKPVDEDCRVKMCEWCYQVVDFCKFRRETVGIGMSYLDRYLCTPKGLEALCNRKEYQLAAMTALYIAIKMHEPLEMETSLLADLSRGCYNEMEFVEMEQTILQALKFRVNGPTALGFVQYFMALISYEIHPSVCSLIMDYARFQLELAISDQAFVPNRPSELAMAAVLNALEGMDIGLFPMKLQQKFIRRMEKATKTPSESVEIVQSRFSVLMVSILAGCDYQEIIQPIIDAQKAKEEERGDDDDEENDDEYIITSKYLKGSLYKRHSPKSVMSVMRR